jgi:hypothetical protein
MPGSMGANPIRSGSGTAENVVETAKLPSFALTLSARFGWYYRGRSQFGSRPYLALRSEAERGP